MPSNPLTPERETQIRDRFRRYAEIYRPNGIQPILDDDIPALLAEIDRLRDREWVLAEAVLAEREACAKIVEDRAVRAAYATLSQRATIREWMDSLRENIATSIRARK